MNEKIALIAIIVVISLSIIFTIIAKKKGAKCIGCPYKNGCKGNCEDKRN